MPRGVHHPHLRGPRQLSEDQQPLRLADLQLHLQAPGVRPDAPEDDVHGDAGVAEAVARLKGPLPLREGACGEIPPHFAGEGAGGPELHLIEAREAEGEGRLGILRDLELEPAPLDGPHDPEAGLAGDAGVFGADIFLEVLAHPDRALPPVPRIQFGGLPGLQGGVELRAALAPVGEGGVDPQPLPRISKAGISITMPALGLLTKPTANRP